MAHLITPITIETESGDYEEFYRFPPPGFTHTTQTSGFQSCCSYYYNLGYPIETILMTEALFGKTNHTASPGTNEPMLGGWVSSGVISFLLLEPWTTSDPDQIAAGFVRFGVCCGQGKYLNLNVFGELSHFYDDVDSLTIKVNGVEVWSHASSIAEGNSLSTTIYPPDGELPDDHPEDPLYYSNATYSFSEFGVAIPLPGLPCGDIVTIEASSVMELRPDEDHTPRYPAWQVSVVSIA